MRSYFGGEENKQILKTHPTITTISGDPIRRPIQEMSYHQDYPPPGTYGSPYPPPPQQQPPVYPPQYTGGYPYHQDPSSPAPGPGGYSYPPHPHHPPPNYNYQGYFNQNQNYPPPPPQPQPTLPPYEVYHCEHDDRDDCSSFLRGCLAALCFCCVLDECCG